MKTHFLSVFLPGNPVLKKDFSSILINPPVSLHILNCQVLSTYWITGTCYFLPYSAILK